MGQKDNPPETSHQPAQAIASVDVIPVIEEQLRIGKRVVQTGKIRISKRVTEREETVAVPLMHEEIQVERIAINQFIDSPPPSIRYEGDTMVIPVTREVAVVEKRLMLVEELHVTKRQNQKQETQSVNLSKETVNVERLNIDRPDYYGAEQSGC
jgi:uncharacterized protein (TIGR02271 family)